MGKAIWSRRNFLSIAGVAMVAVALPVAAVRAGGRAVGGTIESIVIKGKRYIVKGRDGNAMWLRGETDGEFRAWDASASKDLTRFTK